MTAQNRTIKIYDTNMNSLCHVLHASLISHMVKIQIQHTGTILSVRDVMEK